MSSHPILTQSKSASGTKTLARPPGRGVARLISASARWRSQLP